jgi:hypothetical protein
LEHDESKNGWPGFEKPKVTGRTPTDKKADGHYLNCLFEYVQFCLKKADNRKPAPLQLHEAGREAFCLFDVFWKRSFHPVKAACFYHFTHRIKEAFSVSEHLYHGAQPLAHRR